MRTTVMEVSSKTFNKNIDKIEKYVKGKKIMPVIKANGYGTYINKNLSVINRFDIVAVAIVDEAKELRKLGYKKDIFVLNQPYKEDIKDIIKYDVIIGISDFEFLNELNKVNNKIKVHLEIETGMNRTGIKINDLNKFIEKIKKINNIIVEGVYTHLSSADYDFEYTNGQLDKFKEAVNIIKENFNSIKYIHSSASNGIINFNDNISNMVRPGIIIYGYESFKGAKEKIDVKPICKLKTKIDFIKEIDKNESVSYSRKFKANKKMKVATIAIGYADGLRRNLTDGYVVVNNKKAKIIGTICMDSCMIDITDIEDVKIGTDVYIWDNKLITLDEVALKSNTINYEIMSTISYRVPRTFID